MLLEVALPPPLGHGQEDEEAEDEDGDDAHRDGGDGGDPDATTDGVPAIAGGTLADPASVVLLRFRLLLESFVEAFNSRVGLSQCQISVFAFALCGSMLSLDISRYHLVLYL